jgi:hypothetical protein
MAGSRVPAVLFAFGITLAGGLSREVTARATPHDGIVAIVGGQPILVSEIADTVRGWRARWRAGGVTDDGGYTEAALFQEALDRRVDELLLFAEGKRLGLIITPAMVDAELDARAKAHRTTVASLVMSSGMSEASYRGWVSAELLHHALLRRAYPYHRIWRGPAIVDVPDIGLPHLGSQTSGVLGPSDFERLLPIYVADLKQRGTITIEIKAWR